MSSEDDLEEREPTPGGCSCETAGLPQMELLSRGLNEPIQFRGHPDLYDRMQAGEALSCAYGEGDQGDEYVCAVNQDGDLACPPPDASKLASLSLLPPVPDSPQSGIAEPATLQTVRMPVRIKAGGGCEAKLFYELLPEELDQLQEETRYRSAELHRRQLDGSWRHRLSLVLAHPLTYECLAEVVGTFLMTLCVIGSVSSAAIAGSQAGLWEVGIVCGLGVMISIFCTASISGAHLNPAVSLSFALVRPQEFPKHKLLPYWIAQLLGAFLAGLVNYLLWFGVITDFLEIAHPELRRGEPGSVHTACAWGQYTPNPSFPFWTPAPGKEIAISPVAGMLIEAFGTGILAFVIFSITHPLNRMIQSREWVPFIIGLTVAVLISLLGPLTQAGFNPARDFGPRLAAVIFGWGSIAIPGPRSIFWIYIVGPLIGAPIGAAFHDLVFARSYHLKLRTM